MCSPLHGPIYLTKIALFSQNAKIGKWLNLHQNWPYFKASFSFWTSWRPKLTAHLNLLKFKCATNFLPTLSNIFSQYFKLIVLSIFSTYFFTNISPFFYHYFHQNFCATLPSDPPVNNDLAFFQMPKMPPKEFSLKIWPHYKFQSHNQPKCLSSKVIAWPEGTV